MRFRELDGLRGLASLAVVAHHFTGAYNSRYVHDPIPFVDVSWGAFGVQLFFLISGFVILMSAGRASRASEFVISRVSRLYPTYWIALGVAVVVGGVARVPDVPLDPTVILANFTMVQRWFFVRNVNDVFWTLAVEMQFYVLLTLLLLVTRCRITDKVLTWLVVVWLAVAVTVAIWAGPFSRGIDPQHVVTPVKAVLNMTLAEYGPLFCAGMMAYLSRRDGRLRLLAIASAAIAALNALLLHSWVDGAVVAFICGVFIVVTQRKATRALLLPPLQWLGKVSYSLYVVHSILGYAVIRLVWPFIGRDVAMVVVLAVVLVAAALLHRVGEEELSPLMRSGLERLRGSREGVR